MLLEQSVSFRARVFLSQLLSLQTHREIEVFCFVLPKVLYEYTYLWCFLRSDLLQSLNQFTLKWRLTLCTPCYGHYNNSLIWIVSSLVFSTNTLNEFGFEWICVFLSLALLCQVVFFFFLMFPPISFSCRDVNPILQCPSYKPKEAPGRIQIPPPSSFPVPRAQGAAFGRSVSIIDPKRISACLSRAFPATFTPTYVCNPPGQHKRISVHMTALGS